MSKRRLMVEVDCGKKRCKRCRHVDQDDCELFDAMLQCDERERLLRLPACLAAERDAAPPKVLRRVLITDSDDPADNGVYDLVRATDGPFADCGKVPIAKAVDHVHPWPVGRFVDAPTPERIPVVLWGQGKVRP